MYLSACLPAEIWEKILDLLDTKALSNCQHTCLEWKSIVKSYVLSGRLKNRALVSNESHLQTADQLTSECKQTADRNLCCPQVMLTSLKGKALVIGAK